MPNTENKTSLLVQQQVKMFLFILFSPLFRVSRRLLLFIVLSSLSISLFSTPGKEGKLYRKASNYLKEEKFEKAKEKYLELIEVAGENDIYYFETGVSFLKSKIDRDKSLHYFKKALEYSGKDTIPELFYYLGKSHVLNKNYKAAHSSFKKFLPEIMDSDAGKSLAMKVEQIMGNCLYAEKHQSDTSFTKYYLTNLQINTEHPEYAPVYNEKENILVFTSRRPNEEERKAWDGKPYEDIFIARNEGGNWEIKNEGLDAYIPSNTNSKHHDAGIVFSPDNKNLYLYKKDLIWKSTYKDGKWSNAKLIDIYVNNRKEHIPSVALSPDGKTLYFSSNRKGGQGGYDLYKTTFGKDSSWSSPENLGPEINTPFDEDAPYLSDNGKILFFSSKGHKGFGGFDIFKSSKGEQGFSKPENMGNFLNSPADDIYLITDAKADSGYFSSNKPGGKGHMDIYYFSTSCPGLEKTIVKGLVTDESKNPLENVKINLYNDKEQLVNSINTGGLGEFSIEFKPGESYLLEAERKGVSNEHSFHVPKQCDTFNLFMYISFNREATGDSILQTATLHSAFFPIENEISKGESPLDYITSLNAKQTDGYEVQIDSVFALREVTEDTAATSKAGQTVYQEFYGYNKLKTEGEKKNEYQNFIEEIKKKLEKQGELNIEILGSASKVTTTTFKTNKNLAEKRALKAKQILIKNLKNVGMDVNKVKFTEVSGSVNGPEYQNDPENASKYKNHQYVKIVIQ